MKLYERFADKDFHTSIATSFGIDFDAYESIVLPRLRGAGCRNNVVIADTRMLTHALAGASMLPRHAGRLYSASGATADGVFHPKLFFQAGRRRGRIIVSSANLTAPGLAGNLELAGMIACDDTASGEQQLIAQAFAYLSRFVGDKNQQGLSGQLDWMLARTPWLNRATAAAGTVGLADGTQAALLTTGEEQGIGQRFIDLIEEPVVRLIVISPYWDVDLGALAFLANRLSPHTVCVLLDPDSESFPKHALGKVEGVRLYDRGEFHKGRFIHAKLIIAQTAAADHVLLGSANCTVPALGLGEHAGSNEEVCLYRRLPARTVEGVLGLQEILAPDRQIDPATLPDFHLDEELPLQELAAQSPGKFECRGETLSWLPAASYEPSGSTVILLDQHARPLPCRLLPLSTEGGAARYQIEAASERPAFARVERGGTMSAPAIVTLIDRLRATARERSSRQAENALRELDTETEASLLLLDVLNVLERIEQGDGTTKDPLSIPKKRKDEEEAQRDYPTLTYEQFIAKRRKRSGTHTTHNSLAGSDVSLVRNFLNRIVGLAASAEEDDQDEPQAQGNAFDLGDETGDAQGALASGEEFETQKTRREEEERAKDERRKAAARKMTRDQIVNAVNAFRARIRKRKESGALDNHDVFRLRALLMVICTAGFPQPAGRADRSRSRLQVLPLEGDPDSWPLLLGRILFEIFGGNHPAIRDLHLSNEHDQIPDDIIESWATCYWCLQACLAAPLSAPEHKRIVQYLKPLAERVYRLTLPTKDELLGQDVMTVMAAMSESYSERLGVDAASLARGHTTTVNAIFKDLSEPASIAASG